MKMKRSDWFKFNSFSNLNNIYTQVTHNHHKHHPIFHHWKNHNHCIPIINPLDCRHNTTLHCRFLVSNTDSRIGKACLDFLLQSILPQSRPTDLLIGTWIWIWIDRNNAFSLESMAEILSGMSVLILQVSSARHIWSQFSFEIVQATVSLQLGKILLGTSRSHRS